MDATQLFFKLLKNPRKSIRYGQFEIEVAVRRVNQYIHQQKDNPNGFDLMERDWDTAIILDACRFDYFKSENIFEGSLSKEISPGGASQEFIQEIFLDRQLHDTVYVTANPFVSLLDPGTFHDLIVDETWDIGNRQAPPDQVTEAAIRAHNQYPNKRIIVHYMQPHFPIHHPDYEFVNEGITWRHGQFWPMSVSKQDVRDGYRANLRYVLSHVKELIDNIDGKSIITADHGELLGERASPIPLQTYNHHEQLYVSELLEIPWLELEYDKRRKISSDPPKAHQNINKDDQEQRLKALGYI